MIPIWRDYIPTNTTCNIVIYDDGNEIYKKYTNIWFIKKTNDKGKVSLKNKYDDITINSISLWKLKIITL